MKIIELSKEEFEFNHVIDTLTYPPCKLDRFYGIIKEDNEYFIYLEADDNIIKLINIILRNYSSAKNLTVYIVELDIKVKELIKSRHKRLYYSFFR